jgi:hypothetical protein
MSSQIEAVIALVLADAHDSREAAGMGGRWDDGGASRLEEQVKFFRYGISRCMPPEWEKYARQVENNADPEYKTYLRLKDKFRDQ